MVLFFEDLIDVHVYREKLASVNRMTCLINCFFSRVIYLDFM